MFYARDIALNRLKDVYIGVSSPGEASETPCFPTSSDVIPPSFLGGYKRTGRISNLPKTYY